MTEDVKFDRQDGSVVPSQMSELVSIYREVYAEPPYNSGPLWDVKSFQDRTARQAGRDGFAMVTARLLSGELIGYSFGLTFPAGGWWSGDATAPPPAILDADKFAVIELLVREGFRGRGIGQRLLGELLAGRGEAYAVLTAMPDAPARELYRRWGWLSVGTAHHTPESPVLDSLVLPLRNA